MNKLDLPYNPANLKNAQERQAYARLQQLKTFFESGRASAAPPGGSGGSAADKQRWKYQRVLGYGGNGVAAKFRIFEGPDDDHHRDVAVKVQLRDWRSSGLREEKRIMRPVRPATRKQRKLRKDLTPRELEEKKRRWDYNPNPPPPPPPRGAGGEVPDSQKDYIVMDYVPNGDLRTLIAKVNEEDTKFPDRVLWSFFMCLVKQCIGLAYYPRKFHPDRRLDDRDLDERIPPDQQKWRWKNMIHFDYDPLNIFVDNIDGTPEHLVVPKLKLADFGLAGEVKSQKRERRLAKWNFYAPEQFGSEWDFLPAERNGANICNEPVAGNYSIHTNIWCIGQVMFCLMTRRWPLQPPVAGGFKFPILPGNPDIITYGGTLFNGHWEDIDRDLRMVVSLCLAHNPTDRPTLEWLHGYIQGMLATPYRFVGQDDNTIYSWFQNQVLGAPT
ncbi:hypothetical protein SLS62_007749 [Diatrype stigma]|uniref:Protein kinase domain-containing protein n=1 Tax=Diatrype stigma TaxID=117547 RepID=A0AAN9UM84_9PEZI